VLGDGSADHAVQVVGLVKGVEVDDYPEKAEDIGLVAGGYAAGLTLGWTPVKKTIDVWVLRSSWGKNSYDDGDDNDVDGYTKNSLGDGGYFYLEAGRNACGIAAQADSVVLKAADGFGGAVAQKDGGKGKGGAVVPGAVDFVVTGSEEAVESAIYV